MDKTQIVFNDASDIVLGIVCDNSWSILKFTGRYEYLKHHNHSINGVCWNSLVIMCVWPASGWNTSHYEYR